MTYPIVLAHGIARFDVLSNFLFKVDDNSKDDGLHYFRNIRTHLESYGFRVRHTSVEWAGRVDVRARTLKRQIEEVLAGEESDAAKVHVIAHSMGGLDTRHMLYENRAEGFHERIASLTTIGTPHHGSPMADFVVKNTGNLLVKLGLGEGVHDLTTQACREFNEQADGWETGCGVRFRTYAGRQDCLYVFDLLKPAWRIIHAAEGDNDGLVSVQSAKWKDEYFVEPVLDADHLNLVGWWNVPDILHGVLPGELEARIKQVYLDIAQILAAEFPT